MAQELTPALFILFGALRHTEDLTETLVVHSNGDQHMLQYADLSGGLSVLVHHTDGDREFAYTKHTDKVMPLAKKEGWVVIDMKADWKTMFPTR